MKSIKIFSFFKNYLLLLVCLTLFSCKQELVLSNETDTLFEEISQNENWVAIVTELKNSKKLLKQKYKTKENLAVALKEAELILQKQELNEVDETKLSLLLGFATTVSMKRSIEKLTNNSRQLIDKFPELDKMDNSHKNKLFESALSITALSEDKNLLNTRAITGHEEEDGYPCRNPDAELACNIKVTATATAAMAGCAVTGPLAGFCAVMVLIAQGAGFAECYSDHCK